MRMNLKKWLRDNILAYWYREDNSREELRLFRKDSLPSPEIGVGAIDEQTSRRLKLEERMPQFEISGWCTKHNRTSKVIEGPLKYHEQGGFYLKYDCCKDYTFYIPRK